MEAVNSKPLQDGERIAFPDRMSDEQIAAMIWPMRYQVVAESAGMKHVRVTGSDA